jgi:hypothetical protein
MIKPAITRLNEANQRIAALEAELALWTRAVEAVHVEIEKIFGGDSLDAARFALDMLLKRVEVERAGIAAPERHEDEHVLDLNLVLQIGYPFPLAGKQQKGATK